VNKSGECIWAHERAIYAGMQVSYMKHTTESYIFSLRHSYKAFLKAFSAAVPATTNFQHTLNREHFSITIQRFPQAHRWKVSLGKQSLIDFCSSVSINVGRSRHDGCRTAD